MIVFDLNDRQSKWKLNGKEVVCDTRSRSKLHLKARGLIKVRFPTLRILEEVPIRVYNNKTLYLDFYLPLRKTAIEVHGQQHYEYNSQFHTSHLDLIKQRKNDSQKSEWCFKNNIELIVLPYYDEEIWESLLCKHTNNN